MHFVHVFTKKTRKNQFLAPSVHTMRTTPTLGAQNKSLGCGHVVNSQYAPLAEYFRISRSV